MARSEMPGRDGRHAWVSHHPGTALQLLCPTEPRPPKPTDASISEESAESAWRQGLCFRNASGCGYRTAPVSLVSAALAALKAAGATEPSGVTAVSRTPTTRRQSRSGRRAGVVCLGWRLNGRSAGRPAMAPVVQTSRHDLDPQIQLGSACGVQDSPSTLDVSHPQFRFNTR